MSLRPQSWTDSPTQMERIILEASGIQGDHKAVVETAREALVIGGLNVLFCSRQYDNGGRTGLRYTVPSAWSYRRNVGLGTVASRPTTLPNNGHCQGIDHKVIDESSLRRKPQTELGVYCLRDRVRVSCVPA